jgi:hypothetical protein
MLQQIKKGSKCRIGLSKKNAPMLEHGEADDPRNFASGKVNSHEDSVVCNMHCIVAAHAKPHGEYIPHRLS